MPRSAATGGPALSLAGRRALVTAGAGGIGRAIAETFADAGAAVVVCDIDDRALEAVARERPDLRALRCDVADRAQVDAMFDALAGEGLDILVNNAGIAGPTAGIADIDPDDWDRTLAVNLRGQFLCARRAVPMLRAAGGGAIVNLSSAAGRLGFPLRTPYAAGKWGTIGFTQSLAMELGPEGIRVNAILPGVVEGPRQDAVLAAKAAARGVPLDEQRATAVARVSLRTMVSAQDIANMALFVCSDAGRHVSGQSLSVCGNVETLS